jgi:hypothetical protein
MVPFSFLFCGVSSEAKMKKKETPRQMLIVLDCCRCYWR